MKNNVFYITNQCILLHKQLLLSIFYDIRHSTHNEKYHKYNKSTRMSCLFARFPRNAESDKQTLYKL